MIFDPLKNMIAKLGRKVGDLTNLQTTTKTNLVSAVNEVSQQIADLQLADYDSTDESIVFRSSDAATYDSTDESIIINI